MGAKGELELMFESVDRELNSGGLNASELSAGRTGAGVLVGGPGELLPPNPRVNFLLAHGAALDRWKVIPFYLGFVTAPLWDHRSGAQQTVIILGFIGSSFLWTYLLRPWVDGRIGVFRPRVVSERLRKEAARPDRRRRFALYALLLGVSLGAGLGFRFLFHFFGDYHASSWMEHATGVWTFMAVTDCVGRAADRSNLRARRMWNIGAGVVLAGALGFLGATQDSYAIVLVMLGVVSIALALLDLGLLLHFAATPMVAGAEEAVHG
jgi:hypothetical protein